MKYSYEIWWAVCISQAAIIDYFLVGTSSLVNEQVTLCFGGGFVLWMLIGSVLIEIRSLFIVWDIKLLDKGRVWVKWGGLYGDWVERNLVSTWNRFFLTLKYYIMVWIKNCKWLLIVIVYHKVLKRFIYWRWKE